MAPRNEIEPPSEAGEQETVTHDLRSASTRDLDPAAAGPPVPPCDDGDAVDPADPAGGAWVRALLETPVRRQRLGHYVVLGELGRGGMGTVLEAFDRRLDRRVALKVLHRNLGQEHTRRLLREAQALAKLSHPNVVQVYEVGEADGQAFIAMELVQGRSLRVWLSQTPRPGWQECLAVYLQAGEGLAAAHARGLVHRDFKASNAVLDDAGRVRVLDFGLARRVVDSAAYETSLVLSVEEAALERSLTAVGTVMGTPGYMPPEQMRGLEVDARSDQFSYCVALYEALYGERPFEGDSIETLLAAMASGQVRPVPRGTEVPPALRTVLLRGLAAEPSDRWPSMEALAGELRRVATPPKRGWRALGLGVAGGLLALGLGLGLAWQAEVGYGCAGARAQLDGVWDETRRRALEEAILGTKLSYAADTWVRVEARLDDLADAWVAAHTEVCEATSVRQEQSAAVMDLRMACLREGRGALRGAVEVLARVDDPARVEHAVELVAGLPGLSRCEDVEALQAALPRVADAGVAARRVDALREQLAAARTLGAWGRAAESLAVVDAVVAEAEGLSHAPLQAEALLVRGEARLRAGHYAQAEQDAERAYVLAAEHGHRRVEAMAASQLVYVVGERLGRHEAGLQWGTTALALAQGLRAEPEIQTSALTHVGRVLLAQGKPEEALTYLQRSLHIEEQARGPDHPHVAASLDDIGRVLLAQGKQEEALTYLQRALAIREEALGPGHPLVAEARGSLAQLAEVAVHPAPSRAGP